MSPVDPDKKQPPTWALEDFTVQEALQQAKRTRPAGADPLVSHDPQDLGPSNSVAKLPQPPFQGLHGPLPWVHSLEGDLDWTVGMHIMMPIHRQGVAVWKGSICLGHASKGVHAVHRT